MQAPQPAEAALQVGVVGHASRSINAAAEWPTRSLQRSQPLSACLRCFGVRVGLEQLV